MHKLQIKFLNAVKKGRPNFVNAKIRKYFVTVNCRILLLKIDLRKNVVNYFNDQGRPSSRLAAVMFRRTPCSTCILFTN